MGKGKTRHVDRILNYLRTFGSITKKEGHDNLAIENVGGRIWDLKRLGIPITPVWEKGKNRFGDPTKYRRYILHENQQTELPL